jgi:hypothetical protein
MPFKVHEFLHSLGFVHTQTRPDRDDYVTILWDNIVKGSESEFKKCDYDECQIYQVSERYPVLLTELDIRYFLPFSLFANPLLPCSYSLSLLRYFSEICNTLYAIRYSLLPLNSVIGFIYCK